jgi:hypothetical protein
MAIGRQGSFGLTVFLSFAYGFASFVLVINHSDLKSLYEHDFLSHWLLAPLGAFCGFMGATWVHELAHFFAALFVGGHVHKIQIGSGKVLGTFRLMGTACEVHESLRSGLVLFSITSAKQARMKLAFVTGAAPLASLVLAGVSIALLFFICPLDQSSSSIWYYPFPYLVGWTLPCVLFLPGVLLPYRYQYAGRTMETDAMRLLAIPWLTDAEIEKRISAAQTLLTIRDEIDPSTISLDQALERAEATPNDQLAVCTAAAFLREACDPRVLIYYKELVTLFPSSTKRTQFIDQYLTCSLEMDAVSSNSAEMDQLSQELLASNPGNISVVGTGGSILVDIGRIDEGKAMLIQVLEKTESLFDKSYTNIFLALAEKKQGNLDLARDYADRSAKLDPNCPALKRVSDLLSPRPEVKSPQ